jgi:hypothetical protein
VQTNMVVGTFTPSVLLRVARRAGHLDEQQLSVEEVLVTSSPAQFRALFDGDLHVGFTNPDNVIAYRFCPDNPLGRTMDVKIVSGVDRGLGLGLYARTEMSQAELRAATWAVDVATSGFAFILFALANSLGLTRGDYEVIALGSTPRRLEALLAGRCDVTMLNAGNELRAEAAGCRLLARVSEVCSPYLGTVLAVAGDKHVDSSRRLAASLNSAAARVLAGELDDLAAAEAAAALDLGPALAQRYVARMQDPGDGLVRDGRAGVPELEMIIDLRRRYGPSAGISGGVDILSGALAADAGLLLR